MSVMSLATRITLLEALLAKAHNPNGLVEKMSPLKYHQMMEGGKAWLAELREEQAFRLQEDKDGIPR